jgi:DUSAM domain-containing protein
MWTAARVRLACSFSLNHTKCGSAGYVDSRVKRVLSRFRESEHRFLKSMYRMTSLRDSGDLEGARQQMRDVLAVEVVPQYRRMAEEQLRGLDHPPPES